MTYEEYTQKVNSIILTKNGNCPVTPVISMLQGSITNTMLTNALRELEADGLICRKQFNEIPPHVEYSLTPKGEDLLPVFYAITEFGLKYIP